MRLLVHTLFLLSFASVQAQGFLLKTDLFDNSQELENVSREESVDQESFNNATIREVVLEHKGLKIPMLHIDRSSDVVLILGQGLPAPKEAMLHYAALFKNYDIILFDYRWAHQYGWFLTTSFLQCAPVKKVLLNEELVVRAILSSIKEKKYLQVVGLGVCYSNFLFAKIQSDESKLHGKGPFTHLILDSCWHSISSFAESIVKDPYLPTSPQYGGAPGWLKWLTSSRIVSYITTKLIRTCVQDVCTADYLGSLGCPVLFIHGQKDIMVPLVQFKKLWDAADPHTRVALLTPSAHADSVKHSSLYRSIVESYITSETLEGFIKDCVTEK